MENEFRRLLLEQLYESKTNPRRHFDKAALVELADSVKTQGVLVPLLVREGELDRFEIVAGARRFRAAKSAGLADVPVRVVQLSDDQVLEVQVIENLQREDVHELDEAMGYEALLERPGYDVDTIAAKVGKSRGYVYARMKLCALSKEARQAFFDGALNASTALLIARIPSALQAKALKAITQPGERWTGGEMTSAPLTYREAAQHIQQHFMLRLESAPFPMADPQLLPSAGACTTCPKRTGNQRELFDDVKSADVCTDPPCFEKKREAEWKRASAAAKAEGRQVIEGKEAKQIFPYASSNAQGGYVGLDETCYQDPKHRTFRQLLGKKASETTALVRDPVGAVREVLETGAATSLLKESGHAWAKPPRKTTTPAARPSKPTPKGDTDAELRDKAHEAALLAVVSRVADAAKASGGTVKTLQLVAVDYATRCSGLVAGKKGAPSLAQLLKRAKGADTRDLSQLVMECYLNDAIDMAEDELIEQACGVFGVSLKALEQAAFEQLKSERDQETKPKAKPVAKAKGPLARKKPGKSGRKKAA